MIQVGIIGGGKIGQVRHLPEYAAREDVRIAALYDVNLERAQAPVSYTHLTLPTICSV